MNVIFVFSTGTNSTPRSEHEDSKFRVCDTINDTRELLWFILAVELNRNVREVEFFGYTGTCYYVDNCQTLFIGGHELRLPTRIYKGEANHQMADLSI